MMLEVRCCCQPQKLLGWLPVPVNVRPHVGAVVRFHVAEAPCLLARCRFPHGLLERHVDLPIRKLWELRRLPWPTEKELLVERRMYDIRLAFSSEETPIDELRRIRGFVEP